MGLLSAAPEARPRRTLIRTLAAALSAAALLGRGAFAQTGSLETAIKASYLYKFAPFVDWPASAFAGASSPFAICVVGQDPFGPVLDRAVAGQHVGARAIVVTRLALAGRAMPCHIAFIGGSPAQPVKEALRLLRGAPMLTVTDDATTPGMVDFVVANDRVRFRIDDAAAAEGGLTISSKLLSLATAVNAPGAGQ